MTDALWFSRFRVRRDAARERLIAAALGRGAPGEVMEAQHRLLWTAFGDRPDRTRDFLWREAGDGRFYALSAREPEAVSDLFEVDARRFEPALAPGDRLTFQLRVNATKSVGGSKQAGRRGHRCDVAMAVLKPIPKGERAEHRDEAAETAALDWLEARAGASGFRLLERRTTDGARRRSARLDGYRVIRIPRRNADREKATSFGVFDLEGMIEVSDPRAFLSRLAEGFGRAKAFGCGLMLIRRAP